MYRIIAFESKHVLYPFQDTFKEDLNGGSCEKGQSEGKEPAIVIACKLPEANVFPINLFVLHCTAGVWGL